MRYAVKRPSEALQFVDCYELPNLKAMQDEVKGHIETFPCSDGICGICNEEGKLIGLEPNFIVNGDVIVGNVIFMSGVPQDGEFHPLTDVQQETLKRIFLD